MSKLKMKSAEQDSNPLVGASRRQKNNREINKRRRFSKEKGNNACNMSSHTIPNKAEATTVRKLVDPETANYFSGIANLFNGNAIDLEEQSSLCGIALAEARGKELELATDMVVSRILETILQNCNLDQLGEFLFNCTEVFHLIATDKFGSHVAEQALNSLANHLQDESSHTSMEDILNRICKVVAVNASNIMSNPYGSHVLRSLLCLCKGTPSSFVEEFHVKKNSRVLAERLNKRPRNVAGQNPTDEGNAFPTLFAFLVKEILNRTKLEISALVVNTNSALVLQTILKLSIGNDELLWYALAVILGYSDNDIFQSGSIDSKRKQQILVLVEDTTYSHLLEVIIEVAPENLYDKLFSEVFEGSLYEISSKPCGNFVMQALISSTRSKEQIKTIWDELGVKFKELFELGRAGVVATIVAACERLQSNRLECCQALVAALSSDKENSSCIVPHILFLEHFFKDASCWRWPTGEKMNVLGCLLLQIIFKYPHAYIGKFVASLISMDGDQILQAALDAGGSRVLEAFLASGASRERKLKVIAKLEDHYGELALNPSSSFTVEKCFSASNVSLKERIAKSLLDIRAELSKRKHGILLLKKLDIDGYSRQPAAWKSRHISSAATYCKFQAEFSTGNSLHCAGEVPKNSQIPSKKRKSDGELSNGVDSGQDALNNDMTLESQIPGLRESMIKLGFHSKNKKSQRQTFNKIHSGKFKNMESSTSMPFIRTAKGKFTKLRSSKKQR